MSNNNVLGAALSIIDKHIHLNHKEIARKIYAETNYCDQDYNKFIAVITSGELTLREYIRKRRLFFAASELVNNPDRSVADISLEYGYSDQTAFARAIKREFGKTPAEIRKTKGTIPDVRKMLEHQLANKSRLASIIERLESDNLSNTDWHYFENFIHATDVREETIKGFLERLEQLPHLIENYRCTDENPVIFSTIHSAKGLEFDTVYIVDVYDGCLPHSSREDAEEQECVDTYEEERRLFYVAITRARNELYIFCVSEYKSGFVNEVAPPVKAQNKPFKHHPDVQINRTTSSNIFCCAS